MSRIQDLVEPQLLIARADAWIPGTSPSFMKRLDKKRSTETTIGCNAILSQNLDVLRVLIEERGFPINEPFRVEATTPMRQKKSSLWRTPLELAIECGDADNPEMVDYLIKKGALVTVPGLRIALMVISHNFEMFGYEDSGAKDPTALFNTLNKTVVPWSFALREGDGDHHDSMRRWIHIQKQFEIQHYNVEHRLQALNQAYETYQSPETMRKSRPRPRM